MRKICFYCVATHLGGTERCLLELARELRKRPELGFRPWFVLPRGEGPLLEALRSEGIEHHVLEMPASFLRLSRDTPGLNLANGLRAATGLGLYLGRLRRLWARERPVLIESSGIKCHLLSAMALPGGVAPLVWHLRDILEPGPTRALLSRVARLRGVRLVFNSGATARASGFRGAQAEVIHDGIDEAGFRPGRPGNGTRAPVIGTLGVLAPGKGQLEFVRMADRLIRRGSGARFVILGGAIHDTAGSDGYTKKIEREILSLGLSDRVRLAGHVENPAEALRSLDLLVHAAIRPESFGRAVAEAMAMGVPVVAPDAGAIPELIEHGRTGLLFAVGPGSDPVAAMAGSVEALLAEPETSERIARCARERFLDRFTARAHAEKMAGFYRRVLSDAFFNDGTIGVEGELGVVPGGGEPEVGQGGASAHPGV